MHASVIDSSAVCGADSAGDQLLQFERDFDSRNDFVPVSWHLRSHPAGDSGPWQRDNERAKCRRHAKARCLPILNQEISGRG
jgi:hypothetical protein